MSTLRKKPTQERSKLRVKRILDTAALVFAEVGYEAATVEMIAERAGVSIGSLYQFFPNKRALFDAVGAAYLEESKALFDQLMTPERLAQPWDALLDELLDAFFRFHRTSPGFRAVLRNTDALAQFFIAGETLNREVAKQLEGVLALYSTILPQHRETVATVLVETVSAMLLVASRMRDERAARLVAETKVLVRRYLSPYADR